MRRREFMVLLGGVAAAWPLAAHAQQRTMPTIGLLSSTSPDMNADNLRAFHLGLKRRASSKARTCLSSIAGPSINSIGCRRWPPIWSTGGLR